MTNRLPVFTRSPAAPSFRLTYRDMAAITAVQELGFLTNDQLHRLCYGGKPSGRTYAESRLKLLYQHGYLGRIAKPQLGLGAPKVVYSLDEEGRALLGAQRGVTKREIPYEKWSPKQSFFFLEHTLAVNELRITIQAAAELYGHHLLSWVTDKELRTRTMKDVVDDPLGGGKIPIVPDGWGQLQLSTGQKFSFFVEVDRATEDRKQFQRKVRGYLAYWESGAYLKRYQSKSMTVLTVVATGEGSKRVAQLKAWTEGQSHLGRRDTFQDLFWFTDLAAATQEAILTGPIWKIAGMEPFFTLIS